ncbi:MAG: DUF6338 family protein [Smithella sp.]|jgi:small nuclear ribonucleoprotein (snRNP)-like protein
MEIDGIKALTFVLVFVPGYIFIHTLDYHLLQGEKSQFETSIQAILSSVILWTIFLLFPWQPFNEQKQVIIQIFFSIIKNKNNTDVLSKLFENINICLILFVLLCAYSFIISTIYAFLRKNRFTNYFIQLLTKRDYFKEVQFGFFFEAINQSVIITMKNKKKYLGRLIAAPDQKDDHNIVICDSYIQEKSKWSKLVADRLLIDLKEVDLISVRKEDINNA